MFGTLKKTYGGFALAKVVLGVSQTLGCRNDFEGIDAELAGGIGKLGGAIGGFGNNSKPYSSVSLEWGPQIGFESNITATGSLTVGDLLDLFR